MQFLNYLGKDSIKACDKLCSVYRINCNDCAKCYVGQSSRVLSVRIKEHQRDCKNKKETSAVYSHVKESGHSFDFNNVKILDQEPLYFKRLISEMVFITKLDSVNTILDTSNLSNIFKYYINNHMTYR